MTDKPLPHSDLIEAFQQADEAQRANNPFPLNTPEYGKHRADTITADLAQVREGDQKMEAIYGKRGLAFVTKLVKRRS